MSWLWEILNKPKLQITFMDEIEVIGFFILLIAAGIVAWAVICSWFHRSEK